MLEIKNGYGYFIAQLLTGIDMPARTTLVKNKILKAIGGIEKEQLEYQKKVLSDNSAYLDKKGHVQYTKEATDENKKLVSRQLTDLANKETDIPISENEVNLLVKFFSTWDGIVPSELSYVYEYLIDTLGL